MYGARASIPDNTLTDNFWGIILVSEATSGGSEVRSNVIHDNALQGVFLHGSSRNTIVENELSHNGQAGILLIFAEDESSSGNLIATNKIRDNGEYGIFFSNSTANTVNENRVYNSGNTDIFDTTPLQNTYSDNRCDTSSPDRLCKD